MAIATQRVEVLRSYELFGYPIAYYLLEDESLAVQAMREALIEIALDDAFFRLTRQEQKQRVKQIVMKKALCLKV